MVPKSDVEAFLAHYTSATYDPVKAHEYYLKNRELQGRTSTKGMSDTQREAVSYSKNQIGIAKKADLSKSQAAQKAQMEAIRKRSDASRKQIQAKLQGAINKLKAAAEIKPDAVKLNVIPADASPKVKAYLQRQNEIMSTSANNKAGKATVEARKKSAVEIVAARKKANADIKKLGDGMKSAVAKARADYMASRKQIDSKYDKASETEIQNIRTQLPGKPPKVVKPKRARRTRKKGGTSK